MNTTRYVQAVPTLIEERRAECPANAVRQGATAPVERAMISEWVVRVSLDGADAERYRALVAAMAGARLALLHRTDGAGIVFDLLAPVGVKSEPWALHNAKSMRQHGWAAEAATVFAERVEGVEGVR